MTPEDLPEPPESGYRIIGRPYLDASGVNVRWMDKWGDVHQTNFAASMWEDDAWKDKLDDLVARRYAEFEALNDESGQENEMEVVENRIEDPRYENAEVDLSNRVKRAPKSPKSDKGSLTVVEEQDDGVDNE